MELRTRWIDDVVGYFEELGGETNLLDLYDYIRAHPRRALPPSFDAIVRRTIEEHSSDTSIWAKRELPDLFRSVAGIGRGIWALRNYQSPLSRNEKMGGAEVSRGGAEPIALRPISEEAPKTSREPTAPLDAEARRQALERRSRAHHRIVRAVADRAAAAGRSCTCSQYADILCDGAIFEIKSIDGDETAQVRAAVGQLYHYLFIHRNLPGFENARLYAVFDGPLDIDLREFLRARAGIGVISLLPDGTFDTDPLTAEQLPWLAAYV
jgi:hypothetical protein